MRNLTRSAAAAAFVVGCVLVACHREIPRIPPPEVSPLGPRPEPLEPGGVPDRWAPVRPCGACRDAGLPSGAVEARGRTRVAEREEPAPVPSPTAGPDAGDGDADPLPPLPDAGAFIKDAALAPLQR